MLFQAISELIRSMLKIAKNIFAHNLKLTQEYCRLHDEEESCQDTNSTTITYRNTTSSSLRVVVSTSLTPQFEPVSPLFTIDLAPGQLVAKEFSAGRYVNSSYNGCLANCNRGSYLFKDYTACEEYEEKQ